MVLKLLELIVEEHIQCLYLQIARERGLKMEKIIKGSAATGNVAHRYIS